MRTMADSVTPADIPRTIPGLELVAAYITGTYHSSYPAAVARFPHLLHVPVITTPGLPVLEHGDGYVIDIETGDFTPTSGAELYAKLRRAGHTPTAYCNRSTWPAVRRALAAAGIPRRDRRYWIADWTGKPHMVHGAGVVATQYANPATSGGHYDLSTVKKYWPGIDPPPAPKAGPLSTVHRGYSRRLTKAWVARVARGRALAGGDREVLRELITAAQNLLELK